jgi:hypothetical protein
MFHRKGGESDKEQQVNRGRRGSNETELVLVGVVSGKTGNLRSPSIPHAEAESFVSWTLLEPYAIRGRRVKGGGREGGGGAVIGRSNSGSIRRDGT